jgi:hypothetical protein
LDLLQLAFAEQVQGAPMAQTGLLLQEKENLPPGVQAVVSVNDLEH